MNLYLVQHAEAKSKEQDPDRSLTPGGRDDAIKISQVLNAVNLAVDQVWHSGKTRAVQTAGILASRIDPEQGVRKAEGLGPVDDVRPVAEQITAGDQDLMLVGHLPFMEKLTGYLTTGDPEQTVVSFQNAGVVCLAYQQETWAVRWILTKELAAAFKPINT